MKTKILFILILSISLQSCASLKERQEKRNKKFEAAKTLVQSKAFTFEAYRALPIGGANIDLTTNPNAVTVKGDSVSVYLPFFGERFYGNTIGTEGGFKVDLGVMKNYELEVNNTKHKMRLEFDVKQKRENLNLQFTILSKESVSLNVTTSERSYITYQGRIQEIESEQ